MPEKLYCYVDESGQHTFGRLFVVAVVMAGQERDMLMEACEAIEIRTGKKNKWIKTAYELRSLYIQEILATPVFCGHLTYSVSLGTQDYTHTTMQAVAKAIRFSGVTEYKAIITVDGLPHSQEAPASVFLRRMGVRLRRVRGARDESDALIRLADSICGLVVAAMEGQPTMQALFDRAVSSGFLINVSGE
jgi:hypothetical protein